MFCFYFRNFFPCVSLTKQNNYFANRKSSRTSLFIENQWGEVTLYNVICEIRLSDSFYNIVKIYLM